jgi:hypothetical protein
VKCPLCGEEVVFERNLKKHQKGKTCKGFVYERAMLAKGWVALDTRYRHLLPKELPFEIGPCVYVGQGQSRYLHVRKLMWVDATVAGILLDRIEGVMSFAGPIDELRRTLKETKRRLHAEAARRALQNAHAST